MNCWQNLRTHGTCSVATSVLYNRFGPHQIGVAAVNEIKMTRINYWRTERKKCRNIREHSCITLSLLGLTSQWGPLYCRPWVPTRTYNNHDRHPVTKSFLFSTAPVKNQSALCYLWSFYFLFWQQTFNFKLEHPSTVEQFISNSAQRAAVS